jgi:hypothetical protein
LGATGQALASGVNEPAPGGLAVPGVPTLGVSEPEPQPVPGTGPDVPEIAPDPGPVPVVGPSPLPQIDPPAVPGGGSGDQPAPDAGAQAPPQPPEITTAADGDGGSLNVSVRVDSPGTDAPVTQETAPGDVISPPAAPDITPDPAVAGAAASDPSAGSSQSGPTNTNVSVRVLSPGDDGPVSQDSASVPAPGTSQSADAPASPPAADSGGEPTATGGDSSGEAQYHGNNSQYQSSDIQDRYQGDEDNSTASPEPWNWTWNLSICDGDTTSISTESGNQESRDWIWNWVWNWSCDPARDPSTASSPTPTTSSGGSNGTPSSQDRGSGIPQAGPANVNVSVRVLSPGDNGPVTQTSTIPASDSPASDSTPAATPAPVTGGDSPGLWDWTFTWCGETMHLTTAAGAGTGLNWVWNWLWAGDCGSEAASPPAGGGAGGSGDTGGDTAPQATPHPDAQIPAASATATPPSYSLSGDQVTIGPPAVDVPVIDVPGGDFPGMGLFAFALPAAPAGGLLPYVPIASSTSAEQALPWVPASWPGPAASPPQVGVDVDVTVPAIPPVVVTVPSAAVPVLAIPAADGGAQVQVEIAVSVGAISNWAATEPPLAVRPRAQAPAAAHPQAPDAPPTHGATTQSASAGWVQAPASEALPTNRSRHVAEAKVGRTRTSGSNPLPMTLPPLQAVGSAGSAGGSAPGVLLVGIATLVGLFVLAAPGLGRRIRLARIPSPRGRFGSSIDRPG